MTKRIELPKTKYELYSVLKKLTTQSLLCKNITSRHSLGKDFKEPLRVLESILPEVDVSLQVLEELLTPIYDSLPEEKDFLD